MRWFHERRRLIAPRPFVMRHRAEPAPDVRPLREQLEPAQVARLVRRALDDGYSRSSVARVLGVSPEEAARIGERARTTGMRR